MAQHARTQTIFRPANIVWGLLLVFAIVSILFPLYIMFKYSVADKDSFVTGGKYAAPLWPFDPNLDQYRELVGGECFKLTAASLDSLQNEGLPDTLMTGLRAMESDTCAVKSEFTTVLDSKMKAAFQFSETALQHLGNAGVPAATIKMLENLLDEKPLAEKKFLKAIEQQSTYLLTESAFDKLRKRKVPEAVVAELSALRGQEFILERDYLNAVAERIGQEPLTKHRKNLLKYAEGTEVGRAQLVQFKPLFLKHGFVGWQNGQIGLEETQVYKDRIVELASSGWGVGRKDFLIAGVYSLEIALLTVLLSLLIGAPAAFTLARYKFPGLAVMMFCIVSIRLFPDICSVIPVAEAFAKPPLSLIPPFFQVAMAHTLLSLPYVIYICMGVFKTIPKDLEEQAYILGASKFYAFRHVVIPVALSGMAAAAIYIFLLSWNEFIFSYYLLFKSPNVSLPVYLLRILAWTPQPNFLAAISVILSIPVIIFSFAVQRYMISGMTAGAVK